jgi:serine/threonine protein kinase
MEEVPLKRVGRYDLLEVIGRGGAAVVYLARQTDLQRHVALKELAPFHAADNTFAQRFVEESRLAGAMNHANIVTVHEFFETDAVPYIAMEYLPFGSLRQYVDKLSLAQVAGVLEGVLAGLSHGESQRVVHRDLKPENLLVSSDGRVKIADFGVARAIDHAATRNIVTVTGTTIGTPAYMAPEQALGSALSPACDLYSLGIVAWELLAGRTPFAPTDTPVAVLYRQVHEPIAPVSSVVPDIDPRIDAWINAMLSKAPEDRPPSADEAWWELEDIVLDLLGPRWRRDARIALAADTESGPVAQTPAPLTPAPFTEAAPSVPSERRLRHRGGDEPGPQRRAEDEPEPPVVASDPVSAPDPVTEPESPPEPEPDPEPVVRPEPVLTPGPSATVAPRTLPPPSNQTIVRPARRHRDPGPETDATQSTFWRRRLTVIGVLAAMAAAAVIGVLVAGGGGSKGPANPTPSQQAAIADASLQKSVQKTITAQQAKATRADAELEAIVRSLAARRSRAVTRLLNSRTRTAQISAAGQIRSDYRAAATKTRKLTAQTIDAGALTTALDDAGAAYGRLATAVKADSQSRYAAAKSKISSDENTLQDVVKQL